MRYFTILGGLFGFALVFPIALAAGSDAGTALSDAMLGCLTGGALFRGFRHVMLHHVRQVLAEKARLQREAAEQAATASSETAAA